MANSSFSTTTITTPVSVANGGTGAATLTGVLKGNGTSAITAASQLVVADGGTGAATFTDAGVLIGNATGAIQVTTAGTSGQVLTSNGAGVDPTFQAAGSFPLVTSGTFSQSCASGSYTSLFSATSLDGDTHKLYRLITYLNILTNETLAVIAMGFNSTANAYAWTQMSVATNTTTQSNISGSGGDTYGNLLSGLGQGGERTGMVLIDIMIKAEKGASGGTYRGWVGNVMALNSSSTVSPSSRNVSGYWNNTSSNLTSIQIYGNPQGTTETITGSYYLYKA